MPTVIRLLGKTNKMTSQYKSVHCTVFEQIYTHVFLMLEKWKLL